MTLPIMPSLALVGKRAHAHTHTHYRYLAHFWKSFPFFKKEHQLSPSLRQIYSSSLSHAHNTQWIRGSITIGWSARNELWHCCWGSKWRRDFLWVSASLKTMSTTSHLKCQSRLIKDRLAGWKLLRIGAAELALLWLRLGFFAAASFSTATSAVFVLFF